MKRIMVLLVMLMTAAAGAQAQQCFPPGTFHIAGFPSTAAPPQPASIPILVTLGGLPLARQFGCIQF